MNNSLTYSFAKGVATIKLDDGKANAMSVGMLQEIFDALAKAEQDKAVVVIEGRAGMFSGGFDLGAFKRDPQELFTMLKAGAELTERLLSFPYPVVALCTGHAIAMGAFILLSTDLRIGTMAAAKIQVNEVQIGLTLPHFAIETCRQRLSPAHFNLAAITANPYSQAQALAAGFLDEVVDAQDAADVLEKRLNHLLGLNMPAFAATKLRQRKETLDRLRVAIETDIEDWAARFTKP